VAAPVTETGSGTGAIARINVTVAGNENKSTGSSGRRRNLPQLPAGLNDRIRHSFLPGSASRH